MKNSLVILVFYLPLEDMRNEVLTDPQRRRQELCQIQIINSVSTHRSATHIGYTNIAKAL